MSRQKRPELSLPHERDETAGKRETAVPPGSRERIKKGTDDVERGLKDTERRGVPNDLPKSK